MSAYTTVSKYNTALGFDALNDFTKIINSTKHKGDKDFNEVKIRATVINGSIIGVAASIAVKVVGVVIGSPFLKTVGSFCFYLDLTVGFVALAGLAANTAAKQWGVENAQTLEKQE